MSGTIFEVMMIVSRSFFLVLLYFEWVRQGNPKFSFPPIK
jgi:hypothetical protein